MSRHHLFHPLLQMVQLGPLQHFASSHRFWMLQPNPDFPTPLADIVEEAMRSEPRPDPHDPLAYVDRIVENMARDRDRLRALSADSSDPR